MSSFLDGSLVYLLNSIWLTTAILLLASGFVHCNGTRRARNRYLLLWGALVAAALSPVAMLATRHAPALVAVIATERTDQPATGIPTRQIERVEARTTAAPGLRLPAGTRWLAAAWWLVVLVQWSRLLAAGFRLCRIRRRATPGASGREIRIAPSHEVSMPLLIGWFRPTILMPADLESRLSSPTRSLIHLHEQTHWRARDHFTQLGQRLLEGLLWFHPAVRWTRKKLDGLREMACDEAVVRQTGEVRPYIRCLTEVARLRATTDQTLVPGFAGKHRPQSQLDQRVRALLQTTAAKPAGPRLVWNVATAGLLFVAGVLAPAVTVAAMPDRPDGDLDPDILAGASTVEQLVRADGSKVTFSSSARSGRWKLVESAADHALVYEVHPGLEPQFRFRLGSKAVAWNDTHRAWRDRLLDELGLSTPDGKTVKPQVNAAESPDSDGMTAELQGPPPALFSQGQQ